MNAKDMFHPKDTCFSDAEERVYAREDLVFNVTEDLLVKMEELNISKVDLAKRLGKSKSYVTQMLSGSRNMTLSTLSDICFALGFKPEVKIPVKPVEPTTTWVSIGRPKIVKSAPKAQPVKNISLVYNSEWTKVA